MMNDNNTDKLLTGQKNKQNIKVKKQIGSKSRNKLHRVLHFSTCNTTLAQRKFFKYFGQLLVSRVTVTLHRVPRASEYLDLLTFLQHFSFYHHHQYIRPHSRQKIVQDHSSK